MVDKLHVYQGATICLAAFSTLLIGILIHDKTETGNMELKVDNNDIHGECQGLSAAPVDLARTNDSRELTVTINGPVYHGCCSSRTILVSPKTAIDEFLNNVTLVEEMHQRFYTENCVRQEPCSYNCTCKQGNTLVPACIENPQVGGSPRYLKRNIFIKGCCHCENN